MTLAKTDPAYAVAKIDAVGSARPLNRPEMHSKGHGVPSSERHHFRPRLHTRPLLGQHEFTSGEIAVRLR